MGAIYDCIIDLRRNSPTFKHWYAIELTERNRSMLYIPEGFAHGFQTLEHETEVFYQMSEIYEPEYGRGVRWNDPAFGIQLVYNRTDYPEIVTVVRDGDAVLMPSGYHPNVSVPGHRICFLWAMAAHREGEDRQFGVVNVQHGFDQGSSGLEAGRKK